MKHLFSPEELRVLQARLARLSGPAAGPAQTSTERLVTFRRGTSHYAIMASELLGVHAMPRVSRLPEAPPHVLGLTHLNGKIVGVMDLDRLARPDAHAPAGPWAVWVAHETRSALLVADELLDLTDIETSRLTGEPRGAFAGPLAGRLRAVLPGPLLVLEGRLLLDPQLFRPGG